MIFARSFSEANETLLMTDFPVVNSSLSNAFSRIFFTSSLITGQPLFAGSPGVNGQ
ncbi:hypothetical protein D3C80_584580 [compost metagenome]